MTDPTKNGEEPTAKTDRELASLKREFDDLRETVQDLRAERQQTTEQLYQTLRGLGLSGEAIEANVSRLMGHGLTRRAAMLAVVGAVGGAGFMTGRVSAAASTSDGDGDVGTPANPVDVFADGIAKDGTPVSIGDSLVPDAASTHDLGSASNSWANGFIDTVDAGQVTANGIGVDDLVDGSVQENIATLSGGLSGEIGIDVFRDDVSTSNVTIATTTTGGKAIVVGEKSGDAATTFADEVVWARDGTTDVTSTSRGTPDGRTYTTSNATLKLSMAANTYGVVAMAFALDPMEN